MKKNSMLLRLLAAALILIMSLPALCLAEETAELAEGADIRVMSYNILHPDWNDKIPIKGRDEKVMNILKY